MLSWIMQNKPTVNTFMEGGFGCNWDLGGGGINSRNLSILTATTQYKAFPPIGRYHSVIPTHDPQSYAFSLLIDL